MFPFNARYEESFKNRIKFRVYKNRENALLSGKIQERLPRKKKKFSRRAGGKLSIDEFIPDGENPRLMVDDLGLLHARGLDYSPWRYCHTTWLVLIFFGEHDGRRVRGELGVAQCVPSIEASLCRSLSPVLLSPLLVPLSSF